MKNSPEVDSPKSPDVMDVRGIAEVLNLDPADLSYLEGQVRRKEVEGEVLRPGALLEILGRRWNLVPFSRDFAEKLDQLNNFDYRDQFTMPRKGMLPNGYGKSTNAEDKETIYLCSHSMGLKPKALDGYIQGMLENWGDWGVLTQFHGQFPGKDIEVLPRPLMNKVVGAKDNETALMNGLSVNIHLLMVHFYQPTTERFKILIEEHAFPSDLYIAKSQLRLHGISEEDGLVFIKSREGELCIREEDIYDVIQREGSQIACLLLPGVQYLTGQYFNIEKITKWAHEKGCIVGWDLAHAVCNVPMKLHAWNVDFACWCTYKYMCGGQGCHAGIFVHENMWGHHGPKLEGWWGTKDQERFKMKSYIEPALGADSFRISNPSAWATIPVYAALEVFSQVDWKRFRHKQFWLTGFMEYLVKSVNAQLMKDFQEKYESHSITPIRIVTPEDTESRGCQLSLIISGDDTTRFSEALLEAGVICDFRYPDRIRTTPSPMYTRYEEVWRFGELLYELLGGCKRPGNTAADSEATSCSIH